MMLLGRTDASAEPNSDLPCHISVSELVRGIGNAVAKSFPSSMWVKGEVSDCGCDSKGHHYFNLLERRPSGDQVLLPCAIWQSSWHQIQKKLDATGVSLTSGQEMLFQGKVQLYAAQGKLTFHVSDVYPEFTLGQIEAHRRAVLLRLEREGLLGLNRRWSMPPLPLRVALVSSRGAAALKDFESVLSRSGYAFSVLRCDVPVQGPSVESTVCRTLEILNLKRDELRLDVVCIVRGGGSATDLGWWNSYAICAAVARMTIPVITGIGHERDQVAADQVAHSSHATPTAAAEMLCSLVRKSESELNEAKAELVAIALKRVEASNRWFEESKQDFMRSADVRIRDEQSELASLRKDLVADGRRALAPHTEALAHLEKGLQGDTTRPLRQATERLLEIGNTLRLVVEQQTRTTRLLLAEMSAVIAALSQQRLKGEYDLLEGRWVVAASSSEQHVADSLKNLAHLSDMVEAYDPIRTLRRGFSITLNGQGKAVKNAAELTPGEKLLTRLAEGQISSTVTDTSGE